MITPNIIRRKPNTIEPKAQLALQANITRVVEIKIIPIITSICGSLFMIILVNFLFVFYT